LNTVHFAHALLMNEDAASFDWMWRHIESWVGQLTHIRCALMDGSAAMHAGLRNVCPNVIVDRYV
jgi:hypothetical protein